MKDLRRAKWSWTNSEFENVKWKDSNFLSLVFNGIDFVEHNTYIINYIKDLVFLNIIRWSKRELRWKWKLVLVCYFSHNKQDSSCNENIFWNISKINTNLSNVNSFRNWSTKKQKKKILRKPKFSKINEPKSPRVP